VQPAVQSVVRQGVLARPAAPDVSVLTGPPAVLAAEVARKLLAAAPVVVVASADGAARLAAAAARAGQVHAPLLLAGSPPAAGRGSASGRAAAGALRAAVIALRARVVLAVGVPRAVLAAELPGVRVVTGAAVLPATRAPAPLPRVAVLVRRGDTGAGAAAAAATGRAAGAAVITVRGDDPRADPAAITALAAARPARVLAAGAGFGPAGRLAARVAVAETGVQLPGGGQVLFPGRRLVALYGYPGTPGLGVLGRQGLTASISRAQAAAAPYRALSRVPVIPAFEIIATVAQGSPGPDGSYSYQSPVASLRPWVRRAAAAGLYVVLDLQPGRAGLLAQARRYEPLLKLPGVGLALDGEWKLGPGQQPLGQIGTVTSTEINTVIRWLAALTARHRLPQKLLVLHQFRLSMISGEQHLDTRHDNLAIVIHMDGQGAPAVKQQTWNAVTTAAPPRVRFGWKDFLTKDHPMLDPRQTMAHTPQPVMISYQ